MPSALRFSDGSYTRHTDVLAILQRLHVSACVEITGYSNLGKSELLRLLAQPDVWQKELGEAAKEFLPVYVDCNRMAEVTDQGIYELILRCLQESDPALAANEELTIAYERLTTPSSEFQIPLNFSRGLSAAVESSRRKVVLLFDEFDEPFARVDSRVFLNLRAKKDRFDSALVYVTATVHPLSDTRSEDHCAEFCELFLQNPWHLAPLTAGDAAHFVRDAAENGGVEIEQSDVEFLYLWTGGHPGLLSGATQRLLDALAGKEAGVDHWQVQRHLVAQLQEDPLLAQELRKIWQNCTPGQKSGLLALFGGAEADPVEISRLEEMHLLVRVDGKLRAFCRLFALYAQAREESLQKRSAPEKAGATASGLWLDMESGEVLVDGQPVETLTKLEYQLMTLFFENAEK
ncbi:MAG TPA: hypothetical protein PL105_24935, partial [Caldilineaceae bacterium]|nr:hypothetical protein [Caldilineaceae bacterium]